MVGFLTQREKPIAFMSAPLRDVALRYPMLDKQSYALVKVAKKF